EDFHAGRLLDIFVAVKLGTVIDGDGLELTRMCLDQLNHASVHIDRTPVTKLADQGCAGEALDEGDHAVLVGRADDDVHLPVPGFLTILDAGRPLRNVRLAPKAAAILGGGVALSIAHGLAEMLPESSALVLVPFDVGVDRLVTDG